MQRREGASPAHHISTVLAAPVQEAAGIWRIEAQTRLGPGGRAVLHANIYVAAAQRGLVLLDCGHQSSSGGLKNLLAGSFPGKEITRVYLSHGHADHAGAASEYLAEGIEVLAGAGDRDMLAAGGPNGVPAVFRYPPVDLSGELVGGEKIELSEGNALEVVAAPGHTPGSVAFINRDKRIALCGDAVFGPVRGHWSTFSLELATSWRQRRGDLGQQSASLLALKEQLAGHDEVLVLPGHGPAMLLNSKTDPMLRSVHILRRVSGIQKLLRRAA